MPVRENPAGGWDISLGLSICHPQWRPSWSGDPTGIGTGRGFAI